MKKSRPDDDDRSKADAHRERMKQRSRDMYANASDIGEIPPVHDPKRRERCAQSLYEDLVTYYPHSTGKKPFSKAHRLVIDRMQSSVMDGTDVWNEVFRGFAKTSISMGTASWALRNGHRKFIPLLAANKKFAVNLLRMLKTGLQTNDLLFEDYPEVCYPIRKLEGKNQRCAAQTHGGQPTSILWSSDEIWLPTIEGSKASGGICVAFGITGALNGLVRTLPDGRNVRPDWWLADDLQTRATARSATQIENRLDALAHSVMMLGGHSDTIGGCVNGTLFKADDLMCRLTDPELFPSFSGEVVPMVITWPDAHESFWLDVYARVLKAFDPKVPNDRKRAFREATALYQSRRAEADRGSEVTWEHCYREKDGELSALQHAYNILILQGDEVFATECQQKIHISAGETEQLALTDITKKLSGYPQEFIPPDVCKITAMIDVQESSLWWGALAARSDFGGYFTSYGAWPEQPLDVSKTNLRKSIAQKYSKLKSTQARVRAALSDLCDSILGKQWTGEDGRTYEICRCGVDVADGDLSLPIRQWCHDKDNKWRNILQPVMGKGVRPQDEPFGQRKKSKTEIDRGLNWYRLKDPEIRGASIMYVDVNWWKTFIASRWQSASERADADRSWHPDDAGGFYLFGHDPKAHATFGTHHLAERRDRIDNRTKGRTCDVWTLKNNSLPNEYLDVVVGAAVQASAAGGVELRDAGLATTKTRKRKRYTAEEIRAIKEGKA